MGVIHVGSGREVDDVVDELLGGEVLYEGGGDEGLPRPGLAHHHQRQLLLDAQVQEIFLKQKKIVLQVFSNFLWLQQEHKVCQSLCVI